MSVAGITSSLFNTSQATTTNRAAPLQQDFQQLGKDLNAGDLAAAKQDFSALQLDVQRRSSVPHQFHHRISGDSNQFGQLFEQLAQALQSGDLTAAQQAYGTLQQDLQQTKALPTHTTPTKTDIGSLSVTV